MSRVWVSPEREYREFGEVRWEVAWELVKPAAKDKDDIDIDCDIDYLHKAFKSEAAAKKYAKRVIATKETAFGDASVIKQVVGWMVEDDRIAEWQDVGEKEFMA